MNAIRNLRKTAKLSQAQLGQILSVSQTTVSKWEKGINTPDVEMARKIADFFQVSTDVVLEHDQPDMTNILYGVGIPYISSLNEIILAEKSDRRKLEFIPVAMSKAGSHVAYTVGDSSMSPILLPGDQLIICRQNSVDSGDLALLSIGDNYYIRLVQHHLEGLYLYKYLQTCKPQFYTRDEIISRPVKIHGLVVELRRKFKRNELY